LVGAAFLFATLLAVPPGRDAAGHERAGFVTRYPWGDQCQPSGKWMANTHQGHFPNNDIGDDGYTESAPVAQFPPNGYSPYDVAGNEWD